VCSPFNEDVKLKALEGYLNQARTGGGTMGRPAVVFRGGIRKEARIFKTLTVPTLAALPLPLLRQLKLRDRPISPAAVVV